MSADVNLVRITGTIAELGALRYTPAGVPVVELKIDHESDQNEAGGARKVKAEIPAVVFEAQARLVAGARPGSAVSLQGFLGAKSKRSKKLVLHVTNIEFISEQ